MQTRFSDAQPEAGNASVIDADTRRLIGKITRLYRLVFLTDTRGRVEWASDGWREVCGVGPELLGRDLRETIPHLPRPEQSLSILADLRKSCVLTRAPVELPAPDGGTIELDVSIFPLAVGAEQPRCVVIARPRGVHPRIDSDAALLEALSEAVVAVDPDGFIARANAAAARLLGVPGEELEGSAAALLAADADGTLRLLAGLEAEEPVDVRFALRGLHDDPRVVAGTASPHRDAQGVRRGTVLVLGDPDRDRHRVAELERRSDELERCVDTLAHDLRSPLVALLGFSRLLRQDYGDRLDDTGRHFVDRIEQAGHTMESLIHDLLELSRIGQPGERVALVDPRAVLLQLVAELKARLDSAQTKLEIPDHLPLVTCDRTRLYQVFANLIGNAIEHMGDCTDRRISVDVVEEVGCHRIAVRDRGRGVDPEHQDQIFEPFFSTAVRRGAPRGTGMGLAIVRKIAETHGGRAWVTSTSGAGATFHVTLPR